MKAKTIPSSYPFCADRAYNVCALELNDFRQKGLPKSNKLLQPHVMPEWVKPYFIFS
ncbi:hypothetical protein [Treponema parvum]|uniref:hypothetical protein n=1 Tax=Treponema parvum TaxID=138851 RepID=UPI001AEBC37B|nr:hypothetical protein [Treponema parvum]QTQ16181.1 hypothetical protein HXT04_05475 [Treponema parvum]